MISIIICSLNDKISIDLDLNIKNTIGVDYEIVYIYNINNKYSIFEAYNIGVKKARYSICCFMHDDIIYHSLNWGSFVIDSFDKDDGLGAVAIAGCQYLRKMPSFWSIPEYNVFNLIQSDREENRKIDYWTNDSPPKNIIAFDGMWFCVRKLMFSSIQFDELNYQGFHFYDLDIAMQIYVSGYEIKYIPNILIEHTSRGSLTKNWLENSFKFFNKWESSLPVSYVINETSTFELLENKAIISLLKLIVKNKEFKLLMPWYLTAIKVKSGLLGLMRVVLNYNLSLIAKSIKINVFNHNSTL